MASNPPSAPLKDKMMKSLYELSAKKRLVVLEACAFVGSK
jgi:hypothetical protein